MYWVASNGTWDCRIVRWGPLDGRRKAEYFSVSILWGVGMEECEKEGDGLHWLWEIAEEVGPGCMQRDGTEMI